MMTVRVGLAAAFSLFWVSSSAFAQVTPTYLNVLCVWDPGPGDYRIEVLYNPGQVNVHTISDPAITNVACTGHAGDLMGWIQQDLQANGTWNVVSTGGGFGLGNDQLHTALDIFCPDVGGQIIYPVAIASITGHVYPPTSHVPVPQSAAVVNFYCPDNHSTSPPNPPTATYAVDACEDGSPQASAGPNDGVSVRMSLQGPMGTGTGLNSWQVGTNNGGTPSQTSSLPVNVGSCDPAAAQLAQTYMQGQIANLSPADFGVDAYSCPAGELEVYVDTCEDHGSHATYGFQVHCCPPPDPDPVGTTGTNCHGLCMGPPNTFGALSVSWVTHFLGPTNPTFHNPSTVCQDLRAATLQWMNSTVPGGNQLCGINWGANQGGTYVPGTLNMTCSVPSLSDPSCGGRPRVDVCLTYQCEGEGPEAVEPIRVRGVGR